MDYNTVDPVFDYMAIVMDKQALADRDFTMNVILPDVGEQHMLRVKNGVLLVYADTLSDDADVSITCPKNALFAILTNNHTPQRPSGWAAMNSAHRSAHIRHSSGQGRLR